MDEPADVSLPAEVGAAEDDVDWLVEPVDWPRAVADCASVVAFEEFWALLVVLDAPDEDDVWLAV